MSDKLESQMNRYFKKVDLLIESHNNLTNRYYNESKWRRFGDEKPESGVDVLCKVYDGLFNVCRLGKDQDNKHFFIHVDSGVYYYDEIDDILWMPIPPLPNTLEK